MADILLIFPNCNLCHKYFSRFKYVFHDTTDDICVFKPSVILINSRRSKVLDDENGFLNRFSCHGDAFSYEERFTPLNRFFFFIHIIEVE